MLKCMLERSSFIDMRPSKPLFKRQYVPAARKCGLVRRSNANLGSRHDMQRKFCLAISSRSALCQ